MALKEAGIKLTLQGQAEFKSGLSSINQALKTMSTESKLAMAQLGDNAGITQKYNAQMKSLKDEMNLASQKVKMFSDRQKELPKQYDDIQKSLKNANGAYKDSVKETARLKNNYEQMKKALGENHVETKKAKQAWQDSKGTTRDLANEIKDLTKTSDKLSKEMAEMPNNMAKAQLGMQNLSNEAKKLHNEWRNAGGRYADIAKSFDDFGNKAISVGDKLQNAGSFMTSRFTVPIVGGFTAATKMASEFHSEIGKLAPLLAEGGNITAEHRAQIERLGESSRKWAIDYGTNTSQINAGMAELVRNGYTAEQVMGIIPNVLDASIASGEDFNTVMTTSSQVLAQFGLKGKSTAETLKNTQRVTDSLTYVANATASGFNDLGEGMAYVGPVAKSLNMSVEQTASILGILANNGIEASQGGTALRGALTRLLKPSKQNAAAMKDLGINVEDFKNGTLKFPDIIDKIRENTKGWTDEQRAAAIAMAFGTESQTAMNALVNEGGDALRELTAEAENATGATKRMADQMKELPEFKFKQSIAQLKDLGIEIGSKLLPYVVEGAQKIGDFVEAFSKLDDSTQGFILKSAALLAAMGPMLSAFGTLTKGIGGASKAIGSFVKFFGKFTTPLAGSTEALTMFNGALTLTPGLLVGVGGGLAILGGAYAMVNSEAYQAKEAMEQFPNIEGITGRQADSLRGLAKEITSVNANLDSLGTARDVSGLTGNLSSIAKEIDKLNQEKIDRIRESFSRLPADVQESLKATVDASIANIEAQTQRVDEIINRMNEIGNNTDAFKKGVLSPEYVQEMKSLTNEMMGYYAGALADTAEQEKQIRQTLTQDVTQMEHNALNQRQGYLEGFLAEEDRMYRRQQQDLWNLKKEGAISERQYQEEMLNTERAHNSKIIALRKEKAEGLIEIAKRVAEKEGEQLVKGTERYKQEMERIAKATDLTVAEVEALFAGADLEPLVKNMARAGEGATNELNTAVSKWNTAINKFAETKGTKAKLLNTDQIKEFIASAEQAGLTWSDLHLLSKKAEIDDNTKQLIEGAAEAQGGWDKLLLEEKEAKIKVDQLSIEELVANWNSLTLEEKQAQVEARGQDEINMLIDQLGVFQGLPPEEVKRMKAEAQGQEALENIIRTTSDWVTLDIPTKQAILQTQIPNGELQQALINAGVWNNTEFLDKFAQINTNAPDAQNQMASLVSTWLGIPVSEAKSLITSTNAGSTTPLVQSYASSVNSTPESKSSSLVSNLLGVVANTISVLAYNVASGAMKDTKANAKTNAPNITKNTTDVNSWNRTSGNMRDKSSTATTKTPGISGNTGSVRSWISALNSSYSKTSVLTTIHRKIFQRIGAHAEGGRIDMFAKGGDIQWGGMFASGARVPKNYAGIVGEAGPELFQVTRSGVRITPLSSNEKMKGISGVLKEMAGEGKSEQQIINIEINHPVVREDKDINLIAEAVKDSIQREMKRDRITKKGSAMGHA